MLSNEDVIAILLVIAFFVYLLDKEHSDIK